MKSNYPKPYGPQILEKLPKDHKGYGSAANFFRTVKKSFWIQQKKGGKRYLVHNYLCEIQLFYGIFLFYIKCIYFQNCPKAKRSFKTKQSICWSIHSHVLRIIFIPRLTALKKTDVSRGIHLIRKTNPVINTRERGAYFSTWTTTTVLRMEFVRGDNSVRVLNTGNYSIQTNTRTNIEIISETPLCLSDVLLLYISKSFCFWNTFCGLKWLPEILNDTCHSQRNMFLLPVSNTIYQDREWRKKPNICQFWCTTTKLYIVPEYVSSPF